MQEIETVAKNCPHKDCMFRSKLTGGEYCAYMQITGRSRGCGISDCDKYEKGKPKVRSTLGALEYVYDEL